MTWYLPFKISIAKTDVFAIECLNQVILYGVLPGRPESWSTKSVYRGLVTLIAKYYTAISPVFSTNMTNVVCAQSVSKLSKSMLVSIIMIKPNNSITLVTQTVLMWKNCPNYNLAQQCGIIINLT